LFYIVPVNHLLVQYNSLKVKLVHLKADLPIHFNVNHHAYGKSSFLKYFSLLFLLQELARENSHRDRENALQSLRKTTTSSGINSPINTAGTSSMTNSREGSRNVSREQSRNASRESSVSERASNASLSTQMSKVSIDDSTTVINQDPSNTSFDEEKTQARVHSLIEEYTENYSELTERPVKVNN
jgi:hypothetical protein